MCSDPDAKARVIYRLIDDGHVINDVDAEPAALEDVFTAYTNGSVPYSQSIAAGMEVSL